MNVTLYGRTFNFHKVVQQQNSGAMEDYILPYSAVYLRIQKWKNYWNRSTFAKVIVKIKVAPFLMSHGVHSMLYAAFISRRTVFSCQSRIAQYIAMHVKTMPRSYISLRCISYPTDRMRQPHKRKKTFLRFFLFLNKNAFFISPTFFIKNES